MQEETLLTSSSAGSGYLPVSTYPNLDVNNPEGRVILSPSVMLQKYKAGGSSSYVSGQAKIDYEHYSIKHVGGR